MSYMDAFDKLNSNPKEISEEAVRLLIRIADNILKSPLDAKIRTLQKSNATVNSKILTVKGATDCLKLMGFEENNSNFTLPLTNSCKSVEEFKKEISKWKYSPTIEKNINRVEATSSKQVESNKEPIKKIVLPPLKITYSNPFLRRLETYFHQVLQYEDKHLQERAKKLIPLETLEENAQKRFRSVQEHLKKNKLEDPSFSIQEMLLIELLQWFKEDFFTWVDSPVCNHCGGQTKFSHMDTARQYTERVELHKCQNCNQLTAFERYEDLNILLETRRGRCGEWANVFTLLCRSVGWDARFVVYEGDHVWTEVYSFAQKRWLHCDPCENICDTPLVYENGWKKDISYVIAYSAEEIQDVTWRYSSNHKEVLKRRTNVSEDELLTAILKLRSERQKELSESRKQYLTKRLLSELSEFLTEKKPKSDEQGGRTSGSDVWRLARGEIEDDNPHESFTWELTDSDLSRKQITLKYSPSLDKYEMLSENKVIKEVNNWHKGTFECKGLFKKVEKDWNMVYIARKESEKVGQITWKINLISTSKQIDNVRLTFKRATFENGLIDVKICSDKTCVFVKDNEINSNNFSGSTSLTISASLSGGKGDLSWQHAQLFRQSIESEDFPFHLQLTIK